MTISAPAAEGDIVTEPVGALAPTAAIDLALEAVARYRRPDLEGRLHQARARLDDGHVRVLVVGEFKQGKSLLVNALVGAPVCPVRDDVATSVATVVSQASAPVLTVTGKVAGRDGRVVPRRVCRTDVPLAAMADVVAEHVTEQRNPGNRQGLTHVEVGLPSRLLATGLQIVDTPGVGGLRSVHGAATMAALPSADAVLLVSDASQEYTAPELEFLRQAIRLCPNVVCVLTKIDLYPEWRRIAELDVQHLREAGIVADLVAVSSTLRWEAVTRRDPAIDAESGFPVLERYLVKQVAGQADLLARRSTVHDVMMVTDQIGEALRTEEASYRDPDAAERIIGELKQAQERAAALRERSARWQLTLSDGIADLNADVEHDLRDRMREIVRTAENEIDKGGDPTRSWERHCERVRQECATAVSANYLWATERSRELARRVAAHFAEEQEAVLPALRIAEPPVAGADGDLTVPESERWNLAHMALTALRGGYIGVLMFGMLGTVVGLTLINPFSLGAGVLLGGKAISDERRRVIARRQSDAKATVRRYVDEVAFQVGKNSREMLRGIQRELRDHYSDLADQLNRSIKDSVASAERSVRTSQAGRDRRLEEIPRELAVLKTLRERVATLLTAPPIVVEATVTAAAVTPGRNRTPDPLPPSAGAPLVPPQADGQRPMRAEPLRRRQGRVPAAPPAREGRRHIQQPDVPDRPAPPVPVPSVPQHLSAETELHVPVPAPRATSEPGLRAHPAERSVGGRHAMRPPDRR